MSRAASTAAHPVVVEYRRKLQSVSEAVAEAFGRLNREMDEELAAPPPSPRAAPTPSPPPAAVATLAELPPDELPPEEAPTRPDGARPDSLRIPTRVPRP